MLSLSEDTQGDPRARIGTVYISQSNFPFLLGKQNQVAFFTSGFFFPKRNMSELTRKLLLNSQKGRICTSHQSRQKRRVDGDRIV